MAVEKQRHGLGDYSLGPLDQITPPIEIAPQGGSRLRPHRNDPLLTSLAFHSDKTLANIDVLYIQSRQLAQSDARRIKEFEDCQITGAREILLAGRRQEPINLVYGQIGWKPLWHLRSRHELRRIRSNDTLPAQVPEERSQGRKFPRDAASGDPPSMQVRHKGPDRQRVDLSRLDSPAQAIPSFGKVCSKPSRTAHGRSFNPAYGRVRLREPAVPEKRPELL